MANEQRMRPRKRKKVCAFCVDKVTAIDYKVTLVSCAGTGGTAGQDLAALGQVTAELAGVLVIDSGHLINAESTNLLALAGTHTLFVRHEISLLVSLVKKFRF